MNRNHQIRSLLGEVYSGATDIHAWPRILESIGRWLGACEVLISSAYTHELLNNLYARPQGMGADICLAGKPGTPIVLFQYKCAAYIPAELGSNVDDVGLISKPLVNGGDPLAPQCSISLRKGACKEPFSVEDMGLLEEMLPHISRAFNLLLKMGGGVISPVMKHALNLLDVGVILFDHQSFILFSNYYADSILNGGDGVGQQFLSYSNRRQLIIQDLKANRDASLFVKEAVERYFDSIHYHKSVLIPRASAETHYSLQISSLPNSNPARKNDDNALAIGFLVDPHTDQLIDITQLVSLYGLTPAEAKVAALLATGESMRNVAKALSVSANTLKTQVKRVYEKTNVDSRASFVRLALRYAYRHLVAHANP